MGVNYKINVNKVMWTAIITDLQNQFFYTSCIKKRIPCSKLLQLLGEGEYCCIGLTGTCCFTVTDPPLDCSQPKLLEQEREISINNHKS